MLLRCEDRLPEAGTRVHRRVNYLDNRYGPYVIYFHLATFGCLWLPSKYLIFEYVFLYNILKHVFSKCSFGLFWGRNTGSQIHIRMKRWCFINMFMNASLLVCVTQVLLRELASKSFTVHRDNQRVGTFV